MTFINYVFVQLFKNIKTTGNIATLETVKFTSFCHSVFPSNNNDKVDQINQSIK